MTIVRLLAAVLPLPTSVVGISSFKMWCQLGQGPVEDSSQRGVLLPEFGCLAWGEQIGEQRAMTAVLFREILTFVWDPRPGPAAGDAAREVPAQFSVPSAVAGG